MSREPAEVRAPFGVFQGGCLYYNGAWGGDADDVWVLNGMAPDQVCALAGRLNEIWTRPGAERDAHVFRVAFCSLFFRHELVCPVSPKEDVPKLCADLNRLYFISH